MEGKIIKRSSFESTLNDVYRFVLDTGQSVELVLDSVDVSEPHAEDYECFSLLFSGPKKDFLEQKMYQVTHGKLGDFLLFIVPVGESEEKIRYEAVFNRKKAE
jgi:hypothetical protein